ncbi:hydrogenase expression/formation protein [Marinospirillum sp.]|uniref:hydrogenase expression/formation protein n=1 Tax=Marinospirillum sp. TaxID=2183934 RepID=UPI00286FB7B5|nr:hydrogenase expression/formation protein [Marinospirillum sp.]MDR9468649.1 hydrogenase expression/formation protein [Marinospirillum sp.]
MMQPIPAIQLNPGELEPEEQLDYLPLPKEMHTFELPVFPEIGDLKTYQQAITVLDDVQTLLHAASLEKVAKLSLDHLTGDEMTLIQELLGEGEVAIQFQNPALPEIQETRLTGVWWARQKQGEQWQQWLEVAAIPEAVIQHTFANSMRPRVELEGEAAHCNAAPLITELLEASLQLEEGETVGSDKVINLSLLPFTAEDHQLLAQYLGTGETLVLSRGYGNCRITSTATPWIWRVQYFNNTDQLILDTLEAARVPEVACAAREDLEDSAERLQEIKELLYA